MHIQPDTLPTGHAGIVARLQKGPTIHSSAWVVPGATVIGDVILDEDALVTIGTKIPPGSLVLGSPAKIRRQLRLDEQKDIARWAWSYVETAKQYREFY